MSDIQITDAELLETKPKPSNKTNLVMDASLMDLFQLCQYKYKLRQIDLRVPEHNATALTRGSVIHAGKEAYFKALQAGQKFEDALVLQREAAQFAGVNSNIIQTESKRDHITLDFILDTLDRESRFNRANDLAYDIISVEQPFMYVLYEDDSVRFLVIGKIDLLVNWNNYKKVPIDHKSHERDFGTPSRFRNQFINYAYALQSNYLFVNRIGLQKSMTDIERFKRVPLSYDPIYFEQWKDNATKWFWQYYDCLSTGQWIQNMTSCDKFNRACEYLEVCDTTGESSKKHKLLTLYKDGEVWDVSKALSKHGE